MVQRAGFTLPEVLITVLVLTIALTGVISVSGVALRKANNPDKVMTAALLANERLNYYRGQADPFRAVGGTWYKAPRDGEINYNDPAAAPNHHNADGPFNANGRPRLFIREYLYDPTANQRDGLGVDQGASKQRRDLVPGRTFRYNEIPPTPATWARVLPDPGIAALPATPVLTLPLGTPWNLPVNTGRAPRANNHIRNGADLNANGRIQYVREVWVQLNVPKYPLALGFGPDVSPPVVQPGLAPWMVSVTVRVFARIQRVPTLTGANMAYDPTKPLALTVGYFGLMRKMLND